MIKKFLFLNRMLLMKVVRFSLEFNLFFSAIIYSSIADFL